jgi:galactokinase
MPKQREIPVEPWATWIWRFLQERVAGMEAEPPRTVASTQAPSASGLSSSTALILALFEAFIRYSPACEHVPSRTCVRWAYEFEFSIFNGGGMDQLSIARGAATLFHGRAQGLPILAEQLVFPTDWAVLVVDSGTVKNTQDHIRLVRKQRASGDPALAQYMRVVTGTSAAVWSAVRSRDLAALGEAMELAHSAMSDYQGMSTPFLEALRNVAWHTARVRLKVSGAGGGGALVTVCGRPDATRVLELLRAGYRKKFPGVRVYMVDAVAPRVQ